MATLDDVVSTQKGGVTSLSHIANNMAFMSTYLNGNVSAINNVTTTSRQVLAADQSRISIVFHNPGSTTSLIVCPGLDAAGTLMTASFTTRGGGFLIEAKAYLAFSGNCQTAWNAVAETGSANPLTISTK